MKNLLRISLILTLFTATAHAEDRWFQVEVLVFKNPPLEIDNPELWPEYTHIEQPAEYLQLGIQEMPEDGAEASAEVNDFDPTAEITVQNAESLNPFVRLSATEHRLSRERKTLESTANYSILFHEAWNEPVPGRDDVIPIHISGGEQFGRQSELQGFISLYVERYLHFSTDLTLVKYRKSRDPFSFAAEANSDMPALQTLNSFGGLSLINTDSLTSNQIARESNNFYIATESAQLKESRRMRSRHIHYLDNPKFGVIILITPINITQ
ncbi:MAG: CsiV family protein [Reinekea sp.]|jgi:hypothetical protein